MFVPGDEVECIDNTGEEQLTVGVVYTVAEFLAAGDGHDDWWTDLDVVQLVEIGHFENADEYGFEAIRFRKVQRRSLTEWLSTAVDVPALDKGAPKRRVKA